MQIFILCFPGLTPSEKIRSLASSLNSLIEPGFGLLDELFSAGVLSVHEFQEVRCKSSEGIEKQNSFLLQLLSAKNDEKCQIFLNCLKSCGQQHVVNFIQANGG
jgi:hypothetical protein